jgi:Ni/Fe-hydrogenase subunit HybB-like protein
MATAKANGDLFISEDAISQSLYIRDGKPLSEEEVQRRRSIVEKAFLTTSLKEILFMLPFFIIMVIGFGYYIVWQLVEGLTITGLSQKVFWGAYIANFVFWIGVSHVGMLISAVLRMLGLKYRTPITRIAEEVTIVSLVMGAASVLIDMGRLDRAHHILLYSNITSPLVWDVISINFYLTGSLIFFFTPLIPDLAYYRDTLDPEKHRLRVMVYKILSLNWRGTETQFEFLNNRIMEHMKFIILPVALSVHTVVSWIFAMTFRYGWNSTIFGPYFISGAIFSGTAALVTAIVLFTWAYRLEDYITITHIKKVTIILILTNAAYAYMTLNEYLPFGYKNQKGYIELIRILFYGDQAILMWGILIVTMLIPFFMNFWMMFITDQPENRMKIYWLALISSLLVNIGAWWKRYVIILPTLRLPVIGKYDDYNIGGLIDANGYYPYIMSAAEIWITLAQLSFFVFFYWFLNKLVPLIPLWEVEHELEVDGLIDGKTPQRKHEESMGSTDRSFLYHH